MQEQPPINTDIDSQYTAWWPAMEPLIQTRPWVKFLAILGFICCGLLVLVGFFMLAAGAAAGKPIALLGIVYAGSSLLYYFPAKFLLEYAAKISAFQQAPSIDALAAALTRQKSFWKFMGILMVVVLCFYAIMLVLMIALAMIGAVR
ncbi:MAG: hypothetical protein IT445_18410 [Phycisphaeraceae bacterium]|nr:hypothetical protein [Phycisphaeraceae bacterium]